MARLSHVSVQVIWGRTFKPLLVHVSARVRFGCNAVRMRLIQSECEQLIAGCDQDMLLAGLEDKAHS
jgi:hypothetical protein